MAVRDASPTVILGDCIEVMRRLSGSGFRAKLIFADPPFNNASFYDVHNDSVDWDEYRGWTLEWMMEAERLMGDDSILVIHGDDNVCDIVTVLADSVSEIERCSRIIWHYRFGQCQRSNWVNSHAIANVFCKTGQKPECKPPLVESDRAAVYSDPRTQDTQNPGLRPPLTVWGIPSDGPNWGRIQGNNAERIKNHPNQLPEKYLERFILAYTDEGDMVLDPFGGTGTTAVVAHALGRPSVTIEKSLGYCEDIKDRIRKGSVRIDYPHPPTER